MYDVTEVNCGATRDGWGVEIHSVPCFLRFLFPFWALVVILRKALIVKGSTSVSRIRDTVWVFSSTRLRRIGAAGEARREHARALSTVGMSSPVTFQFHIL